MAGLLRRFHTGRIDTPVAQSASAPTLRQILIPLAAAQFLASYDSSSMNVAISNIVQDLDTTVTGVQTAISLFTLTMAALMIPGSKLTDIWGRKPCFIMGLVVYGTGALITSLAPALAAMLIGFSLLEGIGSALMIPPIYILVTLLVPDGKDRVKAFGVVSAMAAVGAATGPLLGGLITTTITWRASFAGEVVAIAGILYMSKHIPDIPVPEPKPKFDLLGTVLSAGGLVLIVLGLLQAGAYGWLQARKDFSIGDTVLLEQGQISPVVVLIFLGLVFLGLFFVHIRRAEKKGREPLLPTRLFRKSMTNLGLITQNSQWFIMIGTSFVISVFFQVSRGYSAIETGVLLTPATGGVLLSSWRIEKMTKRFSQRAIIRAGFAIASAGILFILLFCDSTSNVLLFVPGLLLIGFGAGSMLTASVNVVQSSVPEEDQGSLSGLSRSVSNLGSSMGTAVAGAVLISALISGVSDRANASTVLSDDEKGQVSIALQGNVSAVSDQQLEEQLAGQPQDYVDEVVRINREARDRALGLALLTVMLFGLVGFAAAMFMPPQEPAAADAGEVAPAPG
jgi:MFS family permease